MAIRPTIIQAIPYTKIKSKIYNDNFEMLLDYIDSTVNELNTFVQSQVNSMNNKVTNLRMIGQPIIRLNDVLQSDEIRLEGAKVLKSTYASLASIYGNTYAPPDATDTDTYLYLPDARERTFWGSETFGYIEAGLPNITGWLRAQNPLEVNGCFTTNTKQGDGGWIGSGENPDTIRMDASLSSNIYKNDCKTVQPPGIKIRVVTRYK